MQGSCERKHHLRDVGVYGRQAVLQISEDICRQSIVGIHSWRQSSDVIADIRYRADAIGHAGQRGLQSLHTEEYLCQICTAALLQPSL